MTDPNTATPPPDTTSQPAPGETAKESPSPAATAPGADSGAVAGPQKPTSKDRVAMARERLRLKTERLKAKQAQTEGRAAAEKLAQELDEARRAANEREAEIKQALEDPVGWAAKKGRKADDTIRKFLASDDPNANQVSALEALRAELEAEKSARLKEREEREKREKEAQRAQQEEYEGRAIAGFVKQVSETDAKKYPYINYMWTPQEIARETRALHEWAKKEGHRYSFEEIATYFDKRCKTRYESQEAKRKELFPESAPEPAKGKPGQATRAAASVPKIGQATAPAARERPRAAQARLTREEQAEEDIRLLREASARDRAAAEAQARKH